MKPLARWLLVMAYTALALFEAVHDRQAILTGQRLAQLRVKLEERPHVHLRVPPRRPSLSRSHIFMFAYLHDSLYTSSSSLCQDLHIVAAGDKRWESGAKLRTLSGPGASPAPRPALPRDAFVELRAQAIKCIDKSRLFS